MGDAQVSEWAKSVAILPSDADVKWPAETPATIGPKIPIVLGDDGALRPLVGRSAPRRK